MKTMTKTEAIEYVVRHDENDEMAPEDLRAAYAAIIGREATIDEEDRGLWSELCAVVYVRGYVL